MPLAVFPLAAGGEEGVCIRNGDRHGAGRIVRYGLGEFRYLALRPRKGAEETGGSFSGKGPSPQGNLVFSGFLYRPGTPGGEVFHKGIFAVFFADIGLQQFGSMGMGNQQDGLPAHLGYQVLQAAGSQDGQPFFQMAGAGVDESFRTGCQEIPFLLQGFEPGLGGQSPGQGV